MIFEQHIKTYFSRVVFLSAMLLTSVCSFADGWTPTDGGLVVDLQKGDQILISTIIDGQEYFVCHQYDFNGIGTRFSYSDGHYLKLIQQSGMTTPGATSIWTVDTALARGNYSLGGIAYTLKSSSNYWLRAETGDKWKFFGNLTDKSDASDNKCDVIFVHPTNNSRTISFDPENTLGRVASKGDKFNGEKGIGFAGLPYREVYWLEIPLANGPRAYTNAALITFNTSTSQVKWYKKTLTIDPGKACYSYADHTNDKPHHLTPRTTFRLYIWKSTRNKPLDVCPNSYFFATDEQNYVSYRKTDNSPQRSSDSTTCRKIYTIDWLYCMDRVGSTTKYRTDLLYVPAQDSTYYYVGKRDTYVNAANKAEMHLNYAGTAVSQFKEIRTLPIKGLGSGFPAPANAIGRMVVDTFNTDAQNLDVAFDPAGYFLRTNSGVNVRMRQVDDSTWICEEMWHITEAYAALRIKATMYSGPEYSETDTGFDIPGWSKFITGTEVPVVGGGDIVGLDGWARIHTNRTDSNGHMEFVPANGTRHIHYDYNGFVGIALSDQYPMAGFTSVTIEEPRLVSGFAFDCWTENADGSGAQYHPGDVVNLPVGETTLYAKASYTGTYHVAFSFKQDGRRYFLTHPGPHAPRFSHARQETDWTDTYQGMLNAENDEPNYINTYKLLKSDKGAAGEYVLDPRREMRHGAVDSLLFYEHFAPTGEEYIGLYYDFPNTVVGNNTWAGLFTSTAGWPDFRVADVQNAKLRSTHYLPFDKGSGEFTTRTESSNSDAPWVKYNATDDQFDGVADEADATVFQISRVRVADEHYVIIPDTLIEWTDSIVFDNITTPHPREHVWSKLIGKQLMAVTKLDDDTVYFHPNPDKTLTTAEDLRTSLDYRLTQTFTYIRDQRVESLHTVEAELKPTMETTGNDFSRDIVGGHENPMDIIYQGNYIDIVDTLRITLQPMAGKIKDYYGRWKTGAEGLHVKADGMRYRDIIIRTKTYHYGDPQSKLALLPEKKSYTFNPLQGNSKQLNFTLTRVTTHWLCDAQNIPIREDTISIDTITTQLGMASGADFCQMASGGSAIFTIDAEKTLGDHMTIYTTALNDDAGDRLDTLIITKILYNSVATTLEEPVRVPLKQITTELDELIWSVEDGGNRYYILAKSDGTWIFRKYNQKNSILYKEGTTNVQLVVGSNDGDNSEGQYITPWAFSYVPDHSDQLFLKTEYGIDKYLHIDGDAVLLSSTDSTALTYKYVNVYVNDNANEEEQIRLRYGSEGDNKWLKFTAPSTLSIVTGEENGSIFSWGYLQEEYSLLNNGTYPSQPSAEFGYNSTTPASITTRYKAYKEYTMLAGNKMLYLCRKEETSIPNLVDGTKEWLTDTTWRFRRDERPFDVAKSSGLTYSFNKNSLTTTITPPGTSPTDVKIGGKYVNIVDTLEVRISLKPGAPEYRFKGNWSSYKTIEDAHLKIPIISRTYHDAPYDSLVCLVDGDEYSHTFPSTISIGTNDTHTFTLHTERHTGTQVLNVYNEVASSTGSSSDCTASMALNNPAMTEIRIMDEYGNAPGWCHISDTTANTLTVQCTQNGIRAPRVAYIYIAYAMIIEGKMRFINFRLTILQPSLFVYANNQHLVHSKGASGDSLVNGMQQVHENKRILYYYPDQNVELPLRERAFYGWWRWYRESDDPEIGDTDIPAEEWRSVPLNTGRYNYPYRVIGDSVWVDEGDHSKGKKLVTMGRYTVFHAPSKDYNNKQDPPAKAPQIAPPTDRLTHTYAVDISNYRDNLPLKTNGQINTDILDTMKAIIEPTLSIREIFELHPWTEMAERMEGYKDTIASAHRNLNYMEDHTIIAPLDNRLLLSTEQRYNYDNLKKFKHSESLLGYYMRDDNWASMSDEPDGDGWSRQDSMIWCGGWDADCKWYTYNPRTKAYTLCSHKLIESDDFLNVPAKTGITPGQEADTVYYCLRSRSQKTTGTPGVDENTVDGDYWFNICRYTIIYYPKDKYGPKLETAGKALITNEEIENKYEILGKLDFDYNKPGSEYTVYPHPLPWADASYGYTYPLSTGPKHNRYHTQYDFPNGGEYGIINRIPEASHWDPATTYWYAMEQHGGAENGYMIYCDGMASAGQVAALTLDAQLCEGQKMYFSGYVGNPSNQTGKANPNFTFSVQGSNDGTNWHDITSYMTGDIEPSTSWYQILFPITQEVNYEKYRVRIYNQASNFDGNDFIIDDMCVFASKPPLKVYQANTTCGDQVNDSLTHVVLRVDYPAFDDEEVGGKNMYYTVEKIDGDQHSFVAVEDHYMNETIKEAVDPANPDTIYGYIPMPMKDYTPEAEDSIFDNVTELIQRFEATAGGTRFRQGYVFERNEEDVVRPVMYVVHSAKVTPEYQYKVRMAGVYHELLSSICAMTDELKINNRVTLVVDEEEQTGYEALGLCANATHDISMSVKGSLYNDGASPIDLSGTCTSDWLLYGDTTDVSSQTRYGYKYSDIVKVITKILRCIPAVGTNSNLNAANLSDISRSVMDAIKTSESVTLSDGVDPYTLVSDLVTKGFLTLYRPQITPMLNSGDSLQYVVMPIIGTAKDEKHGNTNVEVCPTPIFVKLKPQADVTVPLILGGIQRDSTQMNQPIVILANAQTANEQVLIAIDSISTNVALDSINLFATDDPEFREGGVHSLRLLPDRTYNFSGSNDDYYANGDTIVLTPDPANNYHMRAGYSYTYNIVLQTRTGLDTIAGGCRVGNASFTVTLVPDRVRWDPKNGENNQWNNPGNWIGIDADGNPIHENAHFAPLPSTSVIIPALSEGLPYPELPDPASISSKDSVRQVGFEYNTCENIRFLPGAAISDQQRLNCTHAVVDMSMPNNKWALRAAPVKGLISGDIYMAHADIVGETSPWEVGSFDADGRNTDHGNAAYYLSLYSTETVRKGRTSEEDSVRSATAEWSKVTNGMTLSLPPAKGWAVYARTASGKAATPRFPKNDDIYYFYDANGNKMYDRYEQNLRALRNSLAGGDAGALAYRPVGTSQNYTLTNAAASTSFVFGNPSMGYIDIWGFIADNSLVEEISYIDTAGVYTTITKAAAENVGTSPNVITNQKRYLPPMHAIVVSVDVATTSKDVTLKTNRVLTNVSKVVRPGAPQRKAPGQLSQGIMTVTATNPCSPTCISRLLLGQGFNDGILRGEDALLTTINIDTFRTSVPATPFNIYSVEEKDGLSIDLRDSIVNVPISFYMAGNMLGYFDPVSHLWFIGVNRINAPLVLYDAETKTERDIMDGICLDIETPVQSHQYRYFIRRKGFVPEEDPLPTDFTPCGAEQEKAIKIIHNGQVLIIRNGHIYTMMGQIVR